MNYFPLLLIMLPHLVFAGPKMDVSDTTGRSIAIELIALRDGQVSFIRQDTGKAFTTSMDVFDSASRTRIEEQAKQLPALVEVPELVPDVVILNRRRKDGSYMQEQTISCKVSLRCRDLNQSCPKLVAKVIFVGQNRRTASMYSVLAVRDFPVEIPPDGTQTLELEPFMTRYDSDNKGTGNAGGYQYSGFLLVVQTPDGKPVMHHSTDALIKRAIASDAKVPSVLAGCAEKQRLTATMRLVR